MKEFVRENFAFTYRRFSGFDALTPVLYADFRIGHMTGLFVLALKIPHRNFIFFLPSLSFTPLTNEIAIVLYF